MLWWCVLVALSWARLLLPQKLLIVFYAVDAQGGKKRGVYMYQFQACIRLSSRTPPHWLQFVYALFFDRFGTLEGRRVQLWFALMAINSLLHHLENLVLPITHVKATIDYAFLVRMFCTKMVVEQCYDLSSFWPLGSFLACVEGL
jgi:hypothetical protein